MMRRWVANTWSKIILFSLSKVKGKKNENGEEM